jgi:hypothetical protein
MADPIDTSGTSVEYVGQDPALSKAWGRNHGAGIGNPGGSAYGGPSSLTGKQKAAPSAIPAQNADPALDKVRAGAAQHSNITEGLPDLSDETRFVPAKGYSPAHGAKGQQAPLASIGKASLPSKLGASADDSAARRASEIKAGQ